MNERMAHPQSCGHPKSHARHAHHLGRVAAARPQQRVVQGGGHALGLHIPHSHVPIAVTRRQPAGRAHTGSMHARACGGWLSIGACTRGGCLWHTRSKSMLLRARQCARMCTHKPAAALACRQLSCFQTMTRQWAVCRPQCSPQAVYSCTCRNATLTIM